MRYLECHSRKENREQKANTMNVLSENRLKGTFVNQGVSCAATLHRPTTAKGPYPTILMVHGWGGTQLTLVTGFIDAFNEAGAL